MAHMKEVYKSEVVPALQNEFKYKSSMQVPRIEKITINMGLGEAIGDKKVLEHAVKDMTQISGQKPVVTLARKSIAGFKIRDGYPIGAKVTLRGEKMWEFVDRFVAISLPRTRDFRGIEAKGFDGRGNYSVGITEQIIFPEIDIDKINSINGMDITFVTSAKTDKEAMALLKEFGIPFKNQKSYTNENQNFIITDKCDAFFII